MVGDPDVGTRVGGVWGLDAPAEVQVRSQCF